MIRVVGPAPQGGDFIEIVIDEGPLRAGDVPLLAQHPAALADHLGDHRDAGLSGAALPVRAPDATASPPTWSRSARDPENPTRIIAPSDRRDEIGIAERELAAMQRDLASMLQQKSHLAALGLAVSKINHDLRNMLASAQLFSDRLSSVPDPNVQRFAPKLMRALERAIAFCQSTLSYGQVKEPPPDRKPGRWSRRWSRKCARRSGLDRSRSVRWVAAVERGLRVDADPDQLFRVLLNLARNALQALEGRAPNDPGRDQLRITGQREGAVVVIEVSDTGPGVPRRRARICSRRSRARPAPAARASASRSRPNSCARMAARSASSTAPSARRSASSFRTARSSSAHAGASGRGPEPKRSETAAGSRSEARDLPIRGPTL